VQLGDPVVTLQAKIKVSPFTAFIRKLMLAIRGLPIQHQGIDLGWNGKPRMANKRRAESAADICSRAVRSPRPAKPRIRIGKYERP
jgi:hypothetical protein